MTYKNLSFISFNDMGFIMPIIYDWSKKNNEGETTRYSALIALSYVQFSIENDKYFSHIGKGEEILGTIINSASEIKPELKKIFNDIINNKWNYSSAPYYNIIKRILTNPKESFLILKIFPKHILKICNLFWTDSPKNRDDESISLPFQAINRRYRNDIEQYFDLKEHIDSDYFPSSAFQTPIYWLLKINYLYTINFILAFINKSVKFYAKSIRFYEKSKFDSSVKISKVFIDDFEIEQWTSHCLWHMYRGTSSPVSPYLLQSIHMALEKHLLETAKDEDCDELEEKLLYLIKNSKSASITSIVTSIVLAYPEKCYNIALILFQTKDFFELDLKRQLSEGEARTLYRIGSGINNSKEDFSKERLETCNDEHRKKNLETLCFEYQIVNYFKTNEEFNSFRNKIWIILDNHYKEIEHTDSEPVEVKHWRLCLARMDARKMKHIVTKNDTQTYTQFVPELEPSLEKYSVEGTKKYTESIEFLPLTNWSHYVYEGNSKKDYYKQYENNPQAVINDLKRVLDLPKTDYYQSYYRSTPIYVSAVLVRDYFDELSDDDKNLCKEIIMEYATLSINDHYFYHIDDGVEQAILSLPYIAKHYHDLMGDIKIILFFTLFEDYRIGETMKFIFDLAVEAIHKLSIFDQADAQAIIYAFIILFPKYNETIHIVEEEARMADEFVSIEKKEVLERFFSENENIFDHFMKNSLSLDISLINNKNDIVYLLVIFKLLANNPEHDDSKIIIPIVLPLFANYVAPLNRSDKGFNYNSWYAFCTTFAEFILKIKRNDISKYLKPFNEKSTLSKDYTIFFNELICAEEKIKSYDNFWYVWNYFKEIIIYELNNNNFYIDDIIEAYLFAKVSWYQNAKTWHAFKQGNHLFFNEIIQKIGHHPSTLYSVIKLICGAGNIFFDYGIDWIYFILMNNLITKMKLKEYTLNYIDSYMRQYIYKNREKIKHDRELKHKVTAILNFIIDKGSVIGYLLRERIL